MKEAKFPSFEEAIYLHTQLIDLFGGSYGIIDRGLLESALARPKSGYYVTLSEQAAALMHSLVSNHCFVDGNKRIAFALTATFLLMNGYSLSVHVDEGERFMLSIAASTRVPLPTIVSWLEDHMTEVTIRGR